MHVIGALPNGQERNTGLLWFLLQKYYGSIYEIHRWPLAEQHALTDANLVGRGVTGGLIIMGNGCRFCIRFGSVISNKSVSPWDKILFQSKSFTVFATIGALVKGWLLIVPKDHVLCLGALSQELHSELEELRSQVSLALEECYGSVTVFEHGPAQPNHSVGCGVDHAHLHILPTQINLIEGVKDVFPDPLKWEPVRNIQETACFYEARLPYLYVEQSPGTGYVATHPNLQSQMFRKVIARHIGKPEQYNWRQFPETPAVLSTVERLEQWLSRHSQAVLIHHA